MEEPVAAECWLCGAAYSGGSFLLCPPCDRRTRRQTNADAHDAELLPLRLRAAEQRYLAEETPPAPSMDDWGEG